MSALGSLLPIAMPQLLPLLQVPLLLLLNGMSKSPSGPESSFKLLTLPLLVLELLGSHLPKPVPPVRNGIHHLRLQLLLRLLISKQLLSQLPHLIISSVMFLLKLLPLPLTTFISQFQVTSSPNGTLG